MGSGSNIECLSQCNAGGVAKKLMHIQDIINRDVGWLESYKWNVTKDHDLVMVCRLMRSCAALL